ncbi:unnamed protein product [Parnassius mnemosyne]|uniref:Uncharacterized protein n=1 Tax=Parnassius mnemosyne TaxID=213953 RepID=A0AAV1LSL6_9NEOP
MSTDPDTALARMQAIQLARERQQKLLEEASARALRERREREERKRAEAMEKLKKLEENGGHRLGTGDCEHFFLRFRKYSDIHNAWYHLDI